MKVEKRSDGVHISGYVNVTGRESRPVFSQKQNKRVIEIIEQRAFANSLKTGRNVVMTLDHQESRVLASTERRSLKLKEDNIGLYAEAIVTDKEVIENAKEIRGWSFTMSNITDTVEERANKLPLRKISALDLSEVTLSLHTVPFYSATSVEVRAESEEDIIKEKRSSEESIEYLEEKADNISSLKARLEKVKGE